MVLAGDSAHALRPTLGQGTSLSFEDAFELSRCIGSYSSIEAAFMNYETNRKKRIGCIQQYSAMIKQRMFSKQSAEEVSNEFKKLLSDQWFFQWLFSYRVDKDYNAPNPLHS